MWFFKNPDNKRQGILFGRVTDKQGSNFNVDVSTGGKTKLPYQRIYLIEGQEDNIEKLRRDKSYEKELLQDIEENPGPMKIICVHCGTETHRGPETASHLVVNHFKTITILQFLMKGRRSRIVRDWLKQQQKLNMLLCYIKVSAESFENGKSGDSLYDIEKAEELKKQIAFNADLKEVQVFMNGK